MPLIVLDAGHGGANPGATYKGRKESEDALALTLAVGSSKQETAGGRRLFCLDPSQFQSLSEPVQRSGESGLQPLWGGSQDGVQHQCRTGAGGIRESGGERKTESGGAQQHKYAGGTGRSGIYQYGRGQ